MAEREPPPYSFQKRTDPAIELLGCVGVLDLLFADTTPIFGQEVGRTGRQVCCEWTLLCSRPSPIGTSFRGLADNRGGCCRLFYEGAGGTFDYWPDGLDGEMRSERPPFSNVALVVDNDRMYHRIGWIGDPELSPPDLSPAAEIHHRPQGGWVITDRDLPPVRFGDKDIRISLVWKAQVQRKPASAETAAPLSPEVIFEISGSAPGRHDVMGRCSTARRHEWLDFEGVLVGAPSEIPMATVVDTDRTMDAVEQRQGRALANLHQRLHEIAAPAWLHHAPVGEGDRVLHFDLHPLNVILSPTGPVVIDWTGASRGDPAVDVAIAWILMMAGSVSTSRLIGVVLDRARRALVNSFLRPFEMEAVKRTLSDVVAWKTLDPHMSTSEQARMWQVVRDAEAENSD
jgi:hypothetical protein